MTTRNRPHYYVLDEHGEPCPEDDLEKWGKWFMTDERRVVRRNTFERVGKEITVSTVFLGSDHNFGACGAPVLWELMVFGLDDDDEIQERFTSREAAIAEHERLLEALR
jgi:hypothetical protein